jgi:hypothetical protein
MERRLMISLRHGCNAKEICVFVGFCRVQIPEMPVGAMQCQQLYIRDKHCSFLQQNMPPSTWAGCGDLGHMNADIYN